MDRSYSIDPRDFKPGFEPDGRTDWTEAIQAAMQHATIPSNPREVRLVSGNWLTGPLHYPGPGVYLKGEGYCGVGPQDGPCTRLVARDEPSDRGPLLSMDASQTGHQWLRNVGMEQLTPDVSGSPRFQTANPPPVVALLGVSNIPSIRRVVVYGNRGTAFYVGTNPQVETAWSENIDFYECGCYGGFIPDGTFGNLPPGGELVKFSGCDRTKFHGGELAYGCSTLPLAYADSMDDFPGVHICSEIRPSGLGVNVGIGSGVFGTAITNMVVGARVSVLDWQDPLSGLLVYGPTYVTLDGLEVEGFHRGIQLGMEDVKGARVWTRPNDIQVSRCRFGGANGWYNTDVQRPTSRTFQADNVTGGITQLSFLGREGDITLGPGTFGVKMIIGANPNGRVKYSGEDSGQNPKWDYAD